MRAIYELVYGPDPEETLFYDKARKAATALVRTWLTHGHGYVNVWIEDVGGLFTFVERWCIDGLEAWMRRAGVGAAQMCEERMDEAARTCVRVVRASPEPEPAPARESSEAIPIPAPGTLIGRRPPPQPSSSLREYARTWPPASAQAEPATRSPSCSLGSDS